MYGFRQVGQKLIYELNSEIIQVEPWGADSLWIRTTRNPEIQDDLPGALLASDSGTPAPSEIQIEISERRATVNPAAFIKRISLGQRSAGQCSG